MPPFDDNPKLSRRDWLALCARSSAGLGLLGLAPALALAGGKPDEELLLGPFCEDVAGVGKGNFLGWYERSSGRHGLIPVGFEGHSVLAHPSLKHTALLLSKAQATSVEIDLRAGHVTRELKTPEGWLFYGHGAFTPDGKYLLTSEADPKCGEGVLRVRDAQTYREVDRISTHGCMPHDLVFLDGGRHALVAHAGELAATPTSPVERKTCITRIELPTGRLLERVAPATGPGVGFSMNHIAHLADGSIVAATFPHPADELVEHGTVYLAAPGRPFERLPMPEEIQSRLKDHALSIAVHEKAGILGVTEMRANLVLFWSFRERKFLGQVECKKPSGLVLSSDAKHFLVATRPGKILRIRVSDLSLEPVESSSPAVINDGHLLRARFGAA